MLFGDISTLDHDIESLYHLIANANRLQYTTLMIFQLADELPFSLVIKFLLFNYILLLVWEGLKAGLAAAFLDCEVTGESANDAIVARNFIMLITSNFCPQIFISRSTLRAIIDLCFCCVSYFSLERHQR